MYSLATHTNHWLCGHYWASVSGSCHGDKCRETAHTHTLHNYVYLKPYFAVVFNTTSLMIHLGGLCNTYIFVHTCVWLGDQALRLIGKLIGRHGFLKAHINIISTPLNLAPDKHYTNNNALMCFTPIKLVPLELCGQEWQKNNESGRNSRNSRNKESFNNKFS